MKLPRQHAPRSRELIPDLTSKEQPLQSSHHKWKGGDACVL